MEKLSLHIEGATRLELERGLTAAREYFETAGVEPGDVYSAMSKVLDEDAGKLNLDDISDHEWSIWHHWEEAELAAAKACYGSLGGELPRSELFCQPSRPANIGRVTQADARS